MNTKNTYKAIAVALPIYLMTFFIVKYFAAGAEMKGNSDFNEMLFLMPYFLASMIALATGNTAYKMFSKSSPKS